MPSVSVASAATSTLRCAPLALPKKRRTLIPDGTLGGPTYGKRLNQTQSSLGRDYRINVHSVRGRQTIMPAHVTPLHHRLLKSQRTSYLSCNLKGWVTHGTPLQACDCEREPLRDTDIFRCQSRTISSTTAQMKQQNYYRNCTPTLTPGLRNTPPRTTAPSPRSHIPDSAGLPNSIPFGTFTSLPLYFQLRSKLKHNVSTQARDVFSHIDISGTTGTQPFLTRDITGAALWNIPCLRPPTIHLFHCATFRILSSAWASQTRERPRAPQ